MLPRRDERPRSTERRQSHPPHVTATSPLAPWTAPRGHSSRAALPPEGRAAPPTGRSRSRFAGDAFQVGVDAQLAQVALGVDQPAVGEEGADRAARLLPVRRGVTVGIASGYGG